MYINPRFNPFAGPAPAFNHPLTPQLRSPIMTDGTNATNALPGETPPAEAAQEAQTPPAETPETPTEAPGLPSAEDLGTVAAETPAEAPADTPGPEEDDSDEDDTEDEDEDGGEEVPAA